MPALLLLTAQARSALAGVIHGIAARITDDEHGQDTIEYIGVLLVVAALITVVVGIVNNGSLTTTITNGAKNLINDVFNAGSGH
jgi:hypothetical protein